MGKVGTPRKGVNVIHGQARGGHNETPEYRIWMGMRNRCNRENHPAYKDYGGRGIFVCDEWDKSFINFFNEMGARPSSSHSLERRDNNAGYIKSNCYWATRKEQSLNRRNNIIITYNNETKTLKEWAEYLGLKYKRIHKRIRVFGWSVEKAFTLGKTHGSRYISQRKVA